MSIEQCSKSWLLDESFSGYKHLRGPPKKGSVSVFQIQLYPGHGELPHCLTLFVFHWHVLGSIYIVWLWWLLWKSGWLFFLNCHQMEYLIRKKVRQFDKGSFAHIFACLHFMHFAVAIMNFLFMFFFVSLLRHYVIMLLMLPSKSYWYFL